jgi:hypothetical protein
MGECHYLDGNAHAAIQMDVVQTLLDRAGIGKDRLCLRWVSAAEGQLFARYVAEYTEAVKSLGPFYADGFQPALKAVRAALASERLRWLMGMGLQLQEKGNVYGDRLDADTYKQRLNEVAGDEFEKALVLGAISETPLSVREIALETGLGIYQTATRLNALEQAHRAAFVRFEGPVARFQAA